MKSTQSEKQQGLWKEMKTAAKFMWQWFTAAQKELTNNSTLISRHEIPNTPFMVIGNKEQGYFIAMGKYRLTQEFTTKEKALKTLEEQPWMIITRIIPIITEATIEVKNDETKKNLKK